MGWQRVDLVVEGARAEALSDALEAMGAISTELSDADEGTPEEHAVFGEPGAETSLWARCRVRALFADKQDLSTAVSEALAGCGIEHVDAASVDRLEDADWVALTQRQFDPMRVGRGLWIVPTWHRAPEPGAVNIVLDPGAAFGTGSHPTTRLCLAWLEAHARAEDDVLDYGCGSGILAIAALKLGVRHARAVDIDPLALEAARYNADRNGVQLEVIDAQCGFEGLHGITIANILANPLRMLAPLLASHTRPGGRIVLSGILEPQAPEVIDAYAPWARLAVVDRDSGWVLLAGERSGAAC